MLKDLPIDRSPPLFVTYAGSRQMISSARHAKSGFRRKPSIQRVERGKNSESGGDTEWYRKGDEVMPIMEYCTKHVITAQGNSTVFDAAKQMRDRNVGSNPGLDSDKKPLGIVTDRDVVMKVVAQGKDPQSTVLRDIMSRYVKFCGKIKEFLRRPRS